MTDAGGNCPADSTNIVTLFTELRAALGSSKLITVASQAARQLEADMNIIQLDHLVDRFHVMSYDYAVSDIPNAGVLSPNAPLFTPSANGTVQMSINYTVSNCASHASTTAEVVAGSAMCVACFFTPLCPPSLPLPPPPQTSLPACTLLRSGLASPSTATVGSPLPSRPPSGRALAHPP